MKKNLVYYMNLKYPFELVPEDDGSYFIRYPDLPGCFSCGDTIEEAIKMGEDARAGWIEVALQHGDEIPEPNSDKYSGQFRLRIPKILHKELAQTADKEGTSLNQYCLYLLTKQHQIDIFEKKMRVKE